MSDVKKQRARELLEVIESAGSIKNCELSITYQRNPCNGMTVLGRRNGVVFMRLPVELQTPIDSCKCTWCREHPDCRPMWDTLAVWDGQGKRAGADVTWTVHMPDARDARGSGE